MKPFFRYYRSILDLRKAFTREWFGHEGAFYRENTSLTGKVWDNEYLKPPRKPNSDGKWPRNYHAYLFTSSLELVNMMIHHVRYTEDESFRKNTLLPVADAVLTFFDQHYERDDDGHLHLQPGQALETYWKAENPTPDIAGLRTVVNGLLSLDKLPDDLKTLSMKLQEDLPPVPLSDDEEQPRVVYAENWSMKKNRENPALYAVFPFRLFGLGHGQRNLNIARETYRHRKNKWHRCWSSNDIQAAYCGLVNEARRQVVGRFRDAVSKQMRFPVFHKAGPDYVPDFDSLGAGMNAVQTMLLQAVGDKLIVLPAWPESWDTRFKLHAPEETIIEGTVRNGELKRLEVTPESRREDVVLGQGWSTSRLQGK